LKRIDSNTQRILGN